MGWEPGKIKVGDKVYHEEQKKEYEVYEVFDDHGIAYCKSEEGTHTFGLRWLTVVEEKEKFIDGTQDTVNTKKELIELLKDYRWKQQHRKIRLGKNHFKILFMYLPINDYDHKLTSYYLENHNNNTTKKFTNKKKMIDHIFSFKEVD